MSKNMFCPRCGKRFSDGTGYCRTCGLSLDGVSVIVSGEAAIAPEKTTRPHPTAIRMGVALFILGTVLGLINSVIKDFGLFPEIYGKIVFLSFVIAGLLCMGGAFLIPATTYKKRKQRDSASDSNSTGQLDTTPLANVLPPSNLRDVNTYFSEGERQPVPIELGSVTEHTTRSLE